MQTYTIDQYAENNNWADIDALDGKLKDVAAQEAIARMGKRVEKADKSVIGASTKKRKRQKTKRLNVGVVPKRGKGHASY